MPVQKIPVEHKFGIVSVTHKKDIERRLEERTKEEEGAALKESNAEEKEVRYLVTEQFVQRFNASTGDDRNQLEKEAKVCMRRVKRKIGLRDAGIAKHVNLSQGWRELILLAVCNSRPLQEEALETLYNSLYYSPISRKHVGSLLDVAAYVVEWLQTSTLAQPFLRTGEIKLLKVAHLVFLRIYYHQLANDFGEYKLKKIELGDALEVFLTELDVYRPFPSVSFSMRFLGVVGRCLNREWKHFEDHVEAREKSVDILLKSTSPDVSSNDNQLDDFIEPEDESKETLLTYKSMEMDINNIENKEKKGDIEDDQFYTLTGDANQGDDNPDPSVTLDQTTSPDFIYHECPSLWLTLKLWRSVSHTQKSIQETLADLDSCVDIESKENWIYDVLSMYIFAEAAKINELVMTSFLDYARKRIPKVRQTHKRRVKSITRSEHFDPGTMPIPSNSSTSNDSFVLALNDFMSLESVGDALIDSIDAIDKEKKNDTTGKEPMNRNAEKPFLLSDQNKTIVDGKAMWHQHDMIVYTQCLGRICMQGNSSRIRKWALLGKKEEDLGLTQLINYNDWNNQEDFYHDWSWEVRHIAVLELVKVISWFDDNPLNDGLRNIAWNSLLKHKAYEKDNRVLEAVKISRIEAEIDKVQLKEMPSDAVSIYARLSTNLAIILLPPLHVPFMKTKPLELKGKKSRVKKMKNKTTADNQKISTGENIMLSNAIKKSVRSTEHKLWSEVQRVATEQFEKEVLQDEKRRQTTRENHIEKEIEKVKKTVPCKTLRQRVK